MKLNFFKPLVLIITILCSINCWADVKSEFFKTTDGIQIRYTFWPSDTTQDKKIVIVLLPGRASFIEKNVDFIEDLVKSGYSVATFDWRGMGGSDRVLNHSQKNHITSFDIYLNDLNQFMSTVLVKYTTGQPVILGASFGGHMGLRYLHDYPHMVKGAILCAPMLDIITDPYPKWFAKILTKLMNSLGFGENYALGRGDFDPSKSTFENNKETSDKKRYLATMDVINKNSQYVIGGPTYGWVSAAYESLNTLTGYEYLQGIRQPILLISAGNDQVIDNFHDQTYCHEMPKCSYKKYNKAAHNIMKDVEPVRTMLLQDIDHFITNMDTVTQQTDRY